MLILYSKLMGTPVAEIRTQSKLGEICDLMINNEDLSVAGVVTDIRRLLMTEKKVANATDIVQLLKDGAILKDKESLSDLGETIRLKKLYDDKLFGLSQKVYTKSGRLVGHVYDYMIESSSLTIKKFYVKRLLRELIIPVSNVISLEGKILTIKEDKGYVFGRPVVETALPN